MAREVPAGRAFIELFLKDDRLRRDLRRMSARVTTISKLLVGVGAAFTAIGVAAGTVAVAGIIKATNAAGDFAETVSKFETVFGDRANVVRDWAEDTAAALGVTRREMLATLSSFQDLFVPIGLDASAAEQMSMQLTELAADLASFNNMKTADVVRDLQAAMTGSSETMKKYGVIVNATAVKQEMLNRNMDPKAATEAEKAMIRLDLIMRSTTAAQGDAVRTADSYNNSLRRLGVGFEELQVEVGQKFLPLLQSLGAVGVEALKQISDAISNTLPEFEKLDDVVLRAAKEGRWDLAGEIIGAQLNLGIRNAIGPSLHDLLFRGLPLSVKTLGGGVATSAIPQALQPAAQALNNLPGITRPGTTAITDQFRALQDLETESMRIEIRKLVAIAERQLKEQERTTEELQNAEGAVFE